jgi:ParB family chromosome partitioning protein
MSSRPSALGRGIGALLPGSPPVSTAFEPAPSARPAPGEIPVDRIDPNPEQPRRRFDESALASLSDSIEQHGVLQPVVVRRVGDRYQLLVGERRWRAARAAGLASIPAVVADVDDRDRLELALIENVQRRDLNPIELALAFRALVDSGRTQDEIGRRVSLDRSTIANHLRLLELPRELQEDVEEQRLSAGHAKALLQVGNPERRRHLRDRIVREQLSVRDAEQLARPAGPRSATRAAGARASKDPNLQRVIDSLRQRLQTRVTLHGDASRGRIEIEYFGIEDLQRLSALLLGDA